VCFKILRLHIVLLKGMTSWNVIIVNFIEVF
jgi:hypothetical protein